MFSVTQQGAVNVIAGKHAVIETSLDEISRVFNECLNEAQPRIVLNLAEVPLFDSAGLEWLLDSVERCSQRGGRLQIAAANGLCRDILRITGVSEQFEQFDDVRDAVRSFTR